MKIRELSIESQRKIIRNVLLCTGYAKYFNSIDDYLKRGYHYPKNTEVWYYVNDGKAIFAINDEISKTLDSNINTRIRENVYQGLEYSSDSHLQYAILIDDKNLARELISSGASIDEEEIQLAAKYGRSNILAMMLDKNPRFNKNIVELPSSCSFARLFWQPAQRCLGYQVDYPEVKKLLNKM